MQAHRVLRLLVAERGFRVLALHDDESVIAELDEHLRTGAGEIRALMAGMWRPWQNIETAGVFAWLRTWNVAHPDDPVRVAGLTPPTARLAHYDAVLDHLRRVDPEHVEEVASRYATLRSAHRIGEHVQLARGIHPGTPFAELAREARAFVPDGAVAAADLIVRFHESSIAAGADLDAGAAAGAAAVLRLRETTGQKIVYWEGLAHTANAPRVAMPAMGMTMRSVGARLREELGERYLSLAIGFGRGRIHETEVPPPAAGFADATFAAAGPPTYLLDLRGGPAGAVAQWLGRPHKVRVIAGIYDARHDADHHVAGGALDEWFDVVLRIREITPTALLAPSPAAPA